MATMPNTIRNQDLSTIESVVFNLAGERGYGLYRQQLPEGALPDQALYDDNGIKIDSLVEKSSYRDVGEDFGRNLTFQYAVSKLYSTRPELTKCRPHLPPELQWDESTLPQGLPYYADHLVRALFSLLYYLYTNASLIQILTVFNEQKARGRITCDKSSHTATAFKNKKWDFDVSHICCDIYTRYLKPREVSKGLFALSKVDHLKNHKGKGRGL